MKANELPKEVQERIKFLEEGISTYKTSLICGDLCWEDVKLYHKYMKEDMDELKAIKEQYGINE